MATISKRVNGRWQAKIRRNGFKTLSKTFLTKAIALQWSRDVESQIDKGTFQSTTAAENTLFPDTIHNYWEEVVKFQKSGDVTRYLLNQFIVYFPENRIIDMTTSVIKKYKDKRLKSVKPDTVRKELLLLKRIFEYSINEWQIHLPKGNPVLPISLPKKSKSRERRLELGEYHRLIQEAKKYGSLIEDIIDFAIETGMRRGEIVKLSSSNLNISKRTILILDTKNGDNRLVPLSTKALTILLKQDLQVGKIFNIKGGSVSQAFGRITRRANLIDLRFHDLRHECASRLFEKGLQIMEVAAITGHKDLSMLKKYTHLRAEDLAKKLG
jgi:integrase